MRTSGMKAAMNGVLNLSTLDGWWLKRQHGINGWQFGNGFTHKPGSTGRTRYKGLIPDS